MPVGKMGSSHPQLQPWTTGLGRATGSRPRPSCPWGPATMTASLATLRPRLRLLLQQRWTGAWPFASLLIILRAQYAQESMWLGRSAPLPLSLFGEEEGEDALHAAALPPALELALLEDSCGLQQEAPPQQQQSPAPEQANALPLEPLPAAQPAELQPGQDPLRSAGGGPPDETCGPEASQEPAPVQEQAAEVVAVPGPSSEQPSSRSGIDWDSVGFSFASEDAEAHLDAAIPDVELQVPEADAAAAHDGPAEECSTASGQGAADGAPAEAADSPIACQEADVEGSEYGDFAAAEDESLPHAAPEDEPAPWGWGPAAEEARPAAISWQDGWDAPGVEVQPAALPTDLSSSLPEWEVEPAVSQPAAAAEWGFGESWAAAEVAAQPPLAQEADVWGVLAGLDSCAEDAAGQDAQCAPPVWEDVAAVSPVCATGLPQLSSDWAGDRLQTWHLLMQVCAPSISRTPCIRMLQHLMHVLRLCRQPQMSYSRAAHCGPRAAPALAGRISC